MQKGGTSVPILTDNTGDPAFLDAFRTMASTSVGRVLLYRLLIEIGRVNGNNEGTEEDRSIKRYKNIRNKLRSLNVLNDAKPGLLRESAELGISNNSRSTLITNRIKKRQMRAA